MGMSVGGKDWRPPSATTFRLGTILTIDKVYIDRGPIIILGCLWTWTITPDHGVRKHTPRMACLISAVWTLGCRYSSRVGHWDVVAYISSTEPATTSQSPTRNELRHPRVYTAEIRHVKRGVCFLTPGSGVIVHMQKLFVFQYRQTGLRFNAKLQNILPLFSVSFFL